MKKLFSILLLSSFAIFPMYSEDKEPQEEFTSKEPTENIIAEDTTSEKPMEDEDLTIEPKEEITSEEAINLSLLGVYVGNKLGVLEESSISVNQIATICGKASKTILNQLKGMIDNGLVERIGRGEYEMKSLGIKQSEKILQELKMRGNR